MRPTILQLRFHKTHINNAIQHFNEIRFIEENLPITQDDGQLEKTLLEHHTDSLRWELEQAQAALFSCHQLKAGSPVKRQHIARIACTALAGWRARFKGRGYHDA